MNGCPHTDTNVVLHSKKDENCKCKKKRTKNKSKINVPLVHTPLEKKTEQRSADTVTRWHNQNNKDLADLSYQKNISVRFYLPFFFFF